MSKSRKGFEPKEVQPKHAKRAEERRSGSDDDPEGARSKTRVILPWQRLPNWIRKFQAAVAQLDRVPGYEPGGRRFESSQPRHIKQRTPPSAGFFVCVAQSSDGIRTDKRFDRSVPRTRRNVGACDDGPEGRAEGPKSSSQPRHIKQRAPPSVGFFVCVAQSFDGIRTDKRFDRSVPRTRRNVGACDDGPEGRAEGPKSPGRAISNEEPRPALHGSIRFSPGAALFEVCVHLSRLLEFGRLSLLSAARMTGIRLLDGPLAGYFSFLYRESVS